MSSRRSLPTLAVAAVVLGASAFATLGSPAQAATSTNAGHRVVTSSDGARQIVDSCGSGLEHVAVIPPASFNPLKASAAALEKYGYAPRPSSSDKAELATWTHYASHPITRTTGCAAAAAKSAVQLRHDLAATSPGARGGSGVAQANRASYNWAGWIADGRTYGEATGHIRVPKITGESSVLSITSESVGLGQGSSAAHPILGAGIDAYWDGTQPQFDTWWDYSSPTYDYEQNLAVDAKPGDDIYVAVVLSNTGIGQFHIVNETTGTDSGTIQKTVKGASPDGTAQWIVWRPQIQDDAGDYQYAPLAHFSQLQFNTLRVKAGTKWYLLTKETKFPSTMVSADGSTTLAVHNSVQGANLFSPAWQAYGP